MKTARNVIWCTLLAFFLATSALTCPAETLPWSRRMADATLVRWPDGRLSAKGQGSRWNYELGMLLEGMDAAWLHTADGRYFHYIKNSVDALVTPDGTIPAWKPGEHQLDEMQLGRQLLLLYGVTRDARYAKAATFLYEQRQQQRTASGCSRHRERYPNPMRLDGLYRAEPFYAEYASEFGHPEAFREITREFVRMNERVRDGKTGLSHHGPDATKREFRAREVGWQMMALVDTIPYYLEDDPGREVLLGQLHRDAEAIAQYQDAKTGFWHPVPDRPSEKGNDAESSTSCMIVYALAKGVRRGYLPESFLANAQRGYQGILRNFVHGEAATNDPKAVGAFVLAATEMEVANDAKLGRGDTVLLDGWYNIQKRPGASGQPVLFHYKWNELSDPGFSLFGHIVRNFGASTQLLKTAPTLENLHRAQVYVLVSPDIPVWNPNPNYMDRKDAAQIAEWVKAGGVLMILENDPQNADLKHLNLLSDLFGIHYNDVLRNHVVGSEWSLGKVPVAGGGPIFHQSHMFYMKDVSTISVSSPAVAQLTKGGDIYMATARYGKGTVFAMVDPWLYNEYTDGRKLPAEYDNYAGGVELMRWILGQVPGRR